MSGVNQYIFILHPDAEKGYFRNSTLRCSTVHIILLYNTCRTSGYMHEQTYVYAAIFGLKIESPWNTLSESH